MKTREFIVPQEAVAEFAEILVEHELSNEIIGTTRHEGLIIEVCYVEKELDGIDKLTDLLEDYQESSDDEDEDD